MEITQIGLGQNLKQVDSFILSLVKERNWVDTKESYESVLQEIKNSLGIHPNLQPLLVLERLSKGVALLRLQRFHKRRDAEIQKSITRLNQKQNDI